MTSEATNEDERSGARVGLLDRPARLVDEARLDLAPARPEGLALVCGEKRAPVGRRGVGPCLLRLLVRATGQVASAGPTSSTVRNSLVAGARRLDARVRNSA